MLVKLLAKKEAEGLFTLRSFRMRHITETMAEEGSDIPVL